MRTRFASGLCGFLLLLLAGPMATAQYGGFSRMVDGLVVDIGLMPASEVGNYAANAPERLMHGGAAVASGQYHLVVALFDAATNARITNAEVSAYVHEIGVGGIEKKLQPMKIAGTVTWGNYFPMSVSAPCRILLTIRLPGREQPIMASFERGDS